MHHAPLPRLMLLRLMPRQGVAASLLLPSGVRLRVPGPHVALPCMVVPYMMVVLLHAYRVPMPVPVPVRLPVRVRVRIPRRVPVRVRQLAWVARVAAAAGVVLPSAVRRVAGVVRYVVLVPRLAVHKRRIRAKVVVMLMQPLILLLLPLLLLVVAVLSIVAIIVLLIMVVIMFIVVLVVLIVLLVTSLVVVGATVVAYLVVLMLQSVRLHAANAGAGGAAIAPRGLQAQRGPDGGV